MEALPAPELGVTINKNSSHGSGVRGVGLIVSAHSDTAAAARSLFIRPHVPAQEAPTRGANFLSQLPLRTHNPRSYLSEETLAKDSTLK